MRRINHSRTRSHNRAAPRNEDGAVLVESAIIIVLLAVLAFGMSDFATVLRQSLTAGSSTRASAHVGSALGNDRYADWEMIQAARASSAELPGNARMIRMIVYRSTTTDGRVPSACVGAGVNFVAGVCNVYRPADFTVARAAVLANGCIPGRAGWCPTSRSVDQFIGTDYLGVWIEIRLDPAADLTPGIPSTKSVHTVMRLEPRVL